MRFLRPHDAISVTCYKSLQVFVRCKSHHVNGLRPGFDMITIIESCDCGTFGLFRKDEQEFIPTSSSAVNLKLSWYSLLSLLLTNLVVTTGEMSMDPTIPRSCPEGFIKSSPMIGARS